MIILKNKGLHLISQSPSGEIVTFDLQMPVTIEEFRKGFLGIERSGTPYTNRTLIFKFNEANRKVCVNEWFDIHSWDWSNHHIRIADDYQSLQSGVFNDELHFQDFLKKYNAYKFSWDPFGEKEKQYAISQELQSELNCLINTDRSVRMQCPPFFSFQSYVPAQDFYLGFSQRFLYAVKAKNICLEEKAVYINASNLLVKQLPLERDYVIGSFIDCSKDQFALSYMANGNYEFQIFSFAECFPEFAKSKEYERTIKSRFFHQKFRYRDNDPDKKSKKSFSNYYPKPPNSSNYNDDLDLDQQSAEFWDDIS